MATKATVEYVNKLNLTVLTVDHSTMMVEISNKNHCFFAKSQETFVSTKLNHFELFWRYETAKLAFLRPDGGHVLAVGLVKCQPISVNFVHR